MKHIHLIGIGGTGLSAIARVLLEKGYTVSGSDQTASPLFEKIQKAGAQTHLGHAAEQVKGADLVIRSSAIPDDNPEVLAAQAAGIAVLKRSEFLKDLTKEYITLAVAGSHGKTTTTAMLVWILNNLKADPTYIVGGVVNQLGRNARAGNGPYFVIEADEYDYMFLGLHPDHAIITNIEHDHPDCFPTEAIYQQAFEAFLKQLKPNGRALICLDDPGAKKLRDKLSETSDQILGYGTSADADYRAIKLRVQDGLPVFELLHQTGYSKQANLGEVRLGIPGQHNILNATAALGMIHQMGLFSPKAVQAVKSFSGAGRRFEVIGEEDGIVIIDDYGHHPTEIAATLKAARMRFPKQRIWAVWQPHTFTRTKTLESAFIQALSLADRTIVLKIYAAREKDPGYSAKQIADALPGNQHWYYHNFEAATAHLVKNLQEQDVLIVFSAGDATEISHNVLAAIKDRKSEV